MAHPDAPKLVSVLAVLLALPSLLPLPSRHFSNHSVAALLSLSLSLDAHRTRSGERLGSALPTASVERALLAPLSSLTARPSAICRKAFRADAALQIALAAAAATADEDAFKNRGG